MRVELISEPYYESLVDLLRELHGWHNAHADIAPELVRQHLRQNLLAADSPLRLAVAINDDETVIGLAAVAVTWSLVEPAPEKNRQLQLKELYVRSGLRSQGAGRALMAWVRQYAADQGCCRIDWPVKASNTRGIAFYEGLGAERVGDRLSYRLNLPARP